MGGVVSLPSTPKTLQSPEGCLRKAFFPRGPGERGAVGLGGWDGSHISILWQLDLPEDTSPSCGSASNCN